MSNVNHYVHPVGCRCRRCRVPMTAKDALVSIGFLVALAVLSTKMKKDE